MEKINLLKNTPTPIHKSYLAAIRNSVGSRMFRNFYAAAGGKTTDVTRNGELSCAFFVSAVLAMFGLIDRPHTTVDGAVAKEGRDIVTRISLLAPEPRIRYVFHVNTQRTHEP